MRAIRETEIETDKLQIGDRIRLKHGYTATCQLVSYGKALMLFDQYVVELPVNREATNRGGWKESDLRHYLIDNIDELIPNEVLSTLGDFNSGDQIRLPYLGEMVEDLKDRAEPDGRSIWPLMKDPRSRLAFHTDGEPNWCWCVNRAKDSLTSFCCVDTFGQVSCCNASSARGVRPVFIIMQ